MVAAVDLCLGLLQAVVDTIGLGSLHCRFVQRYTHRVRRDVAGHCELHLHTPVGLVRLVCGMF